MVQNDLEKKYAFKYRDSNCFDDQFILSERVAI